MRYFAVIRWSAFAAPASVQRLVDDADRLHIDMVRMISSLFTQCDAGTGQNTGRRQVLPATGVVGWSRVARMSTAGRAVLTISSLTPSIATVFTFLFVACR